jgi:hypothetical protein
MAVVPGVKPGDLGLHVSLANRGNTCYYPVGWLQLLDLEGNTSLEEKLPLRILLPRTETLYEVSWAPKSPGSFRLLATFDFHQETLVQGVLEFTVPDTFSTSPVARVSEPTIGQPPTVPTGNAR